MAGRDRMSELARMGGGGGGARRSSDDRVIQVGVASDVDDDKYSVEADAKLFEPVKAGIATIREQTAALKRLDLNAVDTDSMRKLTKTLERVMERATGAGQTVKLTLDDIRATMKKNSSTARTNLWNSNAKDFYDAMAEYNSNYNAIRTRMNENKRRQLRNLPLDTPLTDQQVDQVIDSGREADVMQQAMMGDLSHLEDVVADVEERHAEILKLEKQIMELLQLFKDLQLLVDHQGEQLGRIDVNIDKSLDHITKGREQLVEGEKQQLAARKKRCYLLLLLVAIVVVALIMGGFFGGVFKSS